MKIRCTNNTGEALRAYEKTSLAKDELGRFGETGHSTYELVINKEYLVMGMILGEGNLDFLIDDGGYISAYPYPLFDVIDSKLPLNWYFKSLKYNDEKYPYQEAIWGYYELVYDMDHYEKLIDGDKETEAIYFRRKIEIEKQLNDREE